MTTTLTYQHQRQPENWLYEIKQKGDSQTCYVMVQNVKVSPMMTFLRVYFYLNRWHRCGLRNLFS
jgi:hypothetical protein